jgi:ABC-2 type transport system ATP-binding protein
MLQVDAVHKTFGEVQAVRGVSFELRPGEIVGLLGPNGAGKTTTIRMITGFLAPDRGRVLVLGNDTLDAPRIARQAIGYLPESAPIYPEMRIIDYLSYRARIFGVERGARKRAIDWVMDRCQISNVARRRVGILSKGYRQRVGLAAALLHNPPVLVLDEPTNGLDPTQIQETRALIKELTFERTLLLCSHILPEVERICSRIIIIADGQVRADGSTSALSRGAGPARFRVESRCKTVTDESRTLEILARTPGVAKVEKTGATTPEAGVYWVSWTVHAEAQADLRESIATACSANGLLLRELHRVHASLEAVFMRAVDTETPA